MNSEFRSSCSRIELQHQPTDLHFSSVGAHLALGDISGAVQIFPYSVAELPRDSSESDEEETAEAVLKPTRDFKLESSIVCGKPLSRASVGAVLFNEDGSSLSSADSTGSLQHFDPTNGKRVRRVKHAHKCEIYRIEYLDHYTLASADDHGLIKIWDTRQKCESGEVKAHLDYITDMVYLAQGKEIITSSGDTSLVVSDLRTMKVKQESHNGFQEEGTSLQPLMQERKVVCGTSTGKVAIFSTEMIDKAHAWFSSERTHRGSIDAMITLDDKTIITGCGDGAIRVLRFDPNRLLGVIGRHREPDTIERLSISHDSATLASIGLEDCVRLWDIENLEILGSRKEQDNEEKTKRCQTMLNQKEKKRRKKQQRIPNFFTDLEMDSKS